VNGREREGEDGAAWISVDAISDTRVYSAIVV
jgi:hypothetical protein